MGSSPIYRTKKESSNRLVPFFFAVLDSLSRCVICSFRWECSPGGTASGSFTQSRMKGGEKPMHMMELINCICNVIRAAYPIFKDMYAAIKKKPASDGSDRKRTKLL